jgi:hypothetical protein
MPRRGASVWVKEASMAQKGVASDDKALIVTAVGVLTVAAAMPVLLLMGPWGSATGDTARLTAVLTFIGVLVTALVSLIGLMMKHQSDRRLAQEQIEQGQRLKLDAAMRAGQLLMPTDGGAPAPAAIASGLLALTKLDRADLAVALLVDLWVDGGSAVSDESAVLVIDAALRSSSLSAQLIAAELLCRRSSKLDACQSLHWPSAIDGGWIPEFRPRTKLLLVEALAQMTLAGPSNQSSLRAVAVRLYGIWRDDTDQRVRGCIGKLISALTGQLERVGYDDFMQGTQCVKLEQLVIAARSAATNPDGYLDQLSTMLAVRLQGWADQCQTLPSGPGYLAVAEHGI